MERIKSDSAEDWKRELELFPHPEGGFYRETYRCSEVLDTAALPPRFAGKRSMGTCIYYLLRAEDISVFHRLKSDELWHYYRGGALELHLLSDKGQKTQVLACISHQARFARGEKCRKMAVHGHFPHRRHLLGTPTRPNRVSAPDSSLSSESASPSLDLLAGTSHSGEKSRLGACAIATGEDVSPEPIVN